MIENHFYSGELREFPYHDDYGLGFRFKTDDGEEFEVVGNYNSDGYRKAELSIHSYRGGGGIHFYGSINFSNTNASLKNPNISRCGYLGKGIVLPENTKRVRIDILRPITKEELKDYRWEGYEDTDIVNAFYKEQDILDIVKEYANQIFRGKWILQTNMWDLPNEEIIINN